MRDRIVETTAELDRETCCPRLANRRRVDGPWHSRPSWCPSCAGTWSGFAQPEERGLAFAGPKGATLRRSNFRPIWNAACAGAGLPGLHFHDLGDVGGTLAAATGASLEELMARLGGAGLQLVPSLTSCWVPRVRAGARAAWRRHRASGQLWALRRDRGRFPPPRRRLRRRWPGRPILGMPGVRRIRVSYRYPPGRAGPRGPLI